jgi:hypothetical protein
MNDDELSWDEPGSGLYQYCAVCDKDILLLPQFDSDHGIICRDCYEDTL